MAPKKRGGLGGGLENLIPDKISTESSPKKGEKIIEEGATVMVPIEKVEPNRDQPRKNFDEDALEELSDSIKKFGILQPLIVQDKGSYYEIIAGERRWRAANKAKLKEVPVIVKHYTDQQMVEISLIENIQRENLNPIEEAVAYKRLLEEFNLKQEEVAERVSKSRAAVTNSMRLLKLDERVQQMLIDNELTNGHARALLAVDNKEAQFMMAQDVVARKLSVRDIEKLVKKDAEKANKEEKEPEKDPMDLIYADMAEKLKSRLGTKVNIQHKNGKGKIEIDFYSQDEFERLMELFQSMEG